MGKQMVKVASESLVKVGIVVLIFLEERILLDIVSWETCGVK